jgi:hypothetical protein
MANLIVDIYSASKTNRDQMPTAMQGSGAIKVSRIVYDKSHLKGVSSRWSSPPGV